MMLKMIKKLSIGILLVLVASSIFGSILYWIQNGVIANTLDTFSFALGGGIAVAIISGIIPFFLIDKKEKLSKIFGFGLWGILGAGVIYIMTLNDPKSENSQAFESLNQDISTVMDRATDYERPLGSETKISVEPKSSGELGEMEKLLRITTNNSIEYRNQYENELSNAGIIKLSDAQRLYDDEDIVQTLSILEKLNHIVKRYTDQQDVELDRYRELIKNSDLSDALINDMLKGYEKSLIINKPYFYRIWELENLVLVTLEEQLNWLGTNKELWEPENKQFLFYEDKYLEIYNTYAKKTQDYIDEQLILNEKIQESTKRNMNKIQELL